MSALGHTWRLRASNTQNQNITVTVRARYFRFSSAGALEWSTEQTLINAVSVSATSGTTVSSTVDNSTDKWLGMEVTASYTAAANTNGTGAVALYVETSTDAGTTWPSQDRGRWIGGETLVAGDTTTERLRNHLVR
jgi:hypothetical protein